jgi:hypothetical protein
MPKQLLGITFQRDRSGARDFYKKTLVGARPLNPNFKPSSSSLSMPSFLSSFFACQGQSNSVYMAICTSKLILDLARLHPDAVTSGTILTASL